MLITQEPPMTSQPIAFTTSLDTVALPPQSRLPSQPSMDLNITTLVWPLFTQPITWLHKFHLIHRQLLCPTSTHNQEITGRLQTKTLTTQEHLMISQLTASIMLLDIVESHPLNKLLNQQFTDHNIMIPAWLLFTQQITCCHKSKLLHSPTSIHGQEIIGKQQIKMPTTQEPQMISLLTASTMLLVTVVSLPPNKLLNQLFMDHNTMILAWLQFIQQITCWLKFKVLQLQKLDLFPTNIVDLKVWTWIPWNIAQISMRDSHYWTAWLRQLLIQKQVSTAMLTTDCEYEMETNENMHFNR